MLKILQARLQQYMNRELPDVQAGFRKGRGTRDQIANIRWIMEKAGEFQKNLYFCFIDYAKAFDCVDHNQLWKILKEMEIPDHLICLLRNLYQAPLSMGFSRQEYWSGVPLPSHYKYISTQHWHILLPKDLSKDISQLYLSNSKTGNIPTVH